MKRVALLSVVLLFGSCFKKDLDEFKKAEYLPYTPDVVLPLLSSNIQFTNNLIEISDTLHLHDTVLITMPEWDIKESSSQTPIRYAELKVINQHNLPVRVKIQMYFLNNNKTITDSLFDIQNTFVASHISSEKEEVTSITVLYLDEEKYKRMQKARYVKILYKIKSTGLRTGETYYLRTLAGLKMGIRLEH
ncbi:MAG: hypothetical protein NZ529_00835 [Cytophagaceae bacterium]|nr:hypothetical protein [Cytophagaceae bacterium]MDW8455310.1 hypothetical protein [Cytophagaceae bacterium]